ncbi:type VI secretion system protein TssA [Caballeronia sp. LZ065]|uniref:type VI secretion system protein TssA n=1 Tax=Caballeronia sp. LZ065 TaxID=3038571 RepID=UPI00285CA5D5|nr:type VI secretion system protein TssA [Caballeronia sp. LZ065]MDR5780884.1 type VI secretion system protein TssA [Caballeronia sp. LZ065]
MKQAYPMDTVATVVIDFDALLEPIINDDDNHGAGVSLRYDPVYQQIRDARRHDDATLPMGEWERPLVKADWKRVAVLCSEALATRSKDFQLAAWLCEAWTRMHRVEGLIAGTRLMIALADRYWPHAWPELEPGDADARIAPFAWLNETLPLVLTVHLPLLMIEDREPEYVNLDEWQHVITAQAGEGATLTRDLLDKHVRRAGNLAALVSLHQQVETAQAAWRMFSARLDERLGHDAPHLGRVAETLGRVLQAVTSLIGDNARPAPAEPIHVGDALAHTQFASQEHAMDTVLHELPTTPVSPAMPLSPAGAVPLSRVESRAQAYQLLELVADYLAEQEPHSPTPFLLWRAVAWGKMPLPELMREVVRSEGDMARYLSMLGIE